MCAAVRVAVRIGRMWQMDSDGSAQEILRKVPGEPQVSARRG